MYSITTTPKTLQPTPKHCSQPPNTAANPQTLQPTPECCMYLPDEVEGDVVEKVTQLHKVRQLKWLLPLIELAVIKDTGAQNRSVGKGQGSKTVLLQ